MSLTFTTVIGLEIHVQLNTKTKMFCSCSTDYIGATANTNICPRCTGQPGTLPLLNAKAVELGVKFGLALGCKINEVTRFDRKNYFYADLPKGYQITEFYIPLCEKGAITVTGDDGNPHEIGITRIHLEEDAGKLIHGASDGRIVGSTYSLVDYNRSSVPLAEIVSEPDITSSQEAKEYVSAMRQLVRYLGVSDGDMEKGSMRVDANISQKVSDGRWGNRVEIKNMNSLKALERALEYETVRQRELLSKGETVRQETRNWDDSQGVTVSSRSKEDSNDYRYFPEPDLPPLILTLKQIENFKKDLAELPWEKRERFASQYGLPSEDIGVITEQPELADFYEEVVKAGAEPIRASNWVRTELLRVLRELRLEISQAPVTPKDLAELIKLVEARKISTTAGKQVFDIMVKNVPLDEAMKQAGVEIGEVSSDKLRGMIERIIADNPDVAEVIASGDDKGDKKKKFLQGLAMKESKGQAKPAEILAILDEFFLKEK